MMLCLMFDVVLHRVAVRSAHAECPISLLPLEIQSMLMQPARRIRFQNLNRLRNGHVRRQDNEQMCVIRSSASSENGDAMIASDSSKIFRNFQQHLLRNEISPFFGAEDAVNENVRIPVSHVSTWPRLRDIVCVGGHVRRGAVPKRGLGSRRRFPPGTAEPGFPIPCLRALWRLNFARSGSTALSPARTNPALKRISKRLSPVTGIDYPSGSNLFPTLSEIHSLKLVHRIADLLKINHLRRELYTLERSLCCVRVKAPLTVGRA